MNNHTLSHIALVGILGLALLNLLVVPTFAADLDPAADLDGQTYSVTVGTGDSSWSDDLVFQNGTLHSTACDEYGFSAEIYTANASGQSTAFESHGTSADHGTSHWQGTVSGDTVTGTLTWTQPSQDPVVYPFEGQLPD